MQANTPKIRRRIDIAYDMAIATRCKLVISSLNYSCVLVLRLPLLHWRRTRRAGLVAAPSAAVRRCASDTCLSPVIRDSRVLVLPDSTCGTLNTGKKQNAGIAQLSRGCQLPPCIQMYPSVTRRCSQFMTFGLRVSALVVTPDFRIFTMDLIHVDRSKDTRHGCVSTTC